MKIPVDSFLSGFFYGLFIDGLFAWGLYFKRDADILSQEKKILIKSKIDALGQKLGIKKNLEMRQISHLSGVAQALGNTIFPGKAGIALSPQFFDSIPESQQEFILAHEIFHIKNDDGLTYPLVAGSADVITLIALSVLFPTLIIARLLSTIVGIVALSIFSKWREKCADTLAFSICSNETKKEVIILFENLQNENKKYRNEENISLLSSLWRKILYSSDGNKRYDIFHPPLTRRIKYLKEYDAKNNLVGVQA